MGFPNYVIVHREGIGNEEEDRVIVELLQSFCGQSANEMVGSRIEDMGGQRLRQGRIKNSAEEFYYRIVLREDEVLRCSVLRDLELREKEVVG